MADIWINILGDASKLKGALGEAGGQVDKFAEKIGKVGRTMTIVGGAVTAAFGMIIKKTMDVGDQFDKMSFRTGVAVEDLSTLAYAADICGTDIGTVENSLRFLVRAMSDTSKGVGESKEAFDKLGVSVIDTEGNLRPTIEVMKEAATKIAAMTNETEQINIATRIFGTRYGTQLLPMLKKGGEGIEELMQKARELNLEISTESAVASATLKDTMLDLKTSVGSLGREIGEILIPPLTELAQKAVEMVKKITTWADAHKPLVEIIVKVGATLGVLAAIGGPVLIAISVFMKMKLAIIAVGTALKVLGGLAITNPIGMVIMAVGALYLAWTTNFGGIRDFVLAVVDKIKEALGWLWDKVLWVAEKLGLLKEKTEETLTPTSELAKVTEEVGKKAEGATIEVDNLADSIEELGEQTEETQGIMDEFGNFLESFDDWVARLAKEAEDAAQKIADAAKEAFEKYADEMKSIGDRLFELTNTQREIELKKLEEKKAKLIEIAKQAGLSAKEEIAAIKEIMDWHKAEITLLNEKREILAESKYKVYKEGKLIQSIGIVGGEYAQYLASQGYEVEEIPGWQPTQAGAFLPGYQEGIRYVPKTQLALVHQGEEINPPGQRSYDQQKREINININNPIVRNDDDITKIKQQVDRAFFEFIRQYGRRGFELTI